MNEAKVKVKVKLLLANLIFYSLALTWLLFTEFQGDIQMKKFYLYFDGFNKFVSAVLLVVSLCLFKRRVRRMKQAKFYPAERLMSVHLAIFCVYILSYFGETITASIMGLTFKDAMFYYFKKPAELLPYCRLIVGNTFFIELSCLMNLCMLVLLTYLSVVFSEPLEDYHQRFLLIF